MASHQMETHCSEWLEEALLIFICPQGVSRDPFYPFTRGAFVPSERDPVLCPMPCVIIPSSCFKVRPQTQQPVVVTTNIQLDDQLFRRPQRPWRLPPEALRVHPTFHAGPALAGSLTVSGLLHVCYTFLYIFVFFCN